jgi:hypothetical protein
MSRPCRGLLQAPSHTLLLLTGGQDLSKYIDSKNLLKEWGGELEFDINK